MSSSQRPQVAAESWLARLRPVRDATKDSRPRDEHVSAGLSRCRHARSAPHLCRRSASGSALTTRFQHDWRDPLCARDPPAGLRLFARWCDICLEQRTRVLFGTTTTKSHGVPTSGPSPSTVPRERVRHAIGSSVTLHCQDTEVPCCDSQPWLFHRGFAGKPNKCEGILYPSLASSVTPIALSSRSPSLCVATVESTEF